MKLFKNCRIIFKDKSKILHIEVDDFGIISNILDTEPDKKYDEIYDIKNRYLLPGFIDCHTHGFDGYSSEDCCKDLREMALKYAKRGTTSFCSTIGPRSFSDYLKIIEEHNKAFSISYEGATFLGLHLEGPYLSRGKSGAIDTKSIYDVDLKELEEFLKLSKGFIKIMTIAPEVPFAIEAIKLLKKYNITVSAGHSNAGFDMTKIALKEGITRATHTFNAMRAFKHRDTGILGAVLLDDKVVCELIADGIHVDENAIKILYKIKGEKGIACVSDGGESCGRHYEDGFVFEDGCIVKNGGIFNNQGILCGSTKDLYYDFKYLLSIGFTPYEAVLMTSSNAAESLNINKGKIKKGYDADFIIMDNNFNLINTFVRGNKIRGEDI